MICKKCNFLGSVTLRKKDVYCDTCFIANTNHKFRACIGKNRILSQNENVLICISGGTASTVLIDLIHNGISLDNHKKLRIKPFFLHLINNDSTTEISAVKQQYQKYNFNINIVHVSAYFNEHLQLQDANCIPEIDHETQNAFNHMLKNMPPTIGNDFLLNIKRTLYIKCARLLQCSCIFTAESNSTLAINLLANLAIGRGSQVQNDMGFVDNRTEEIKIVRPMKDISNEELKYYICIKRLDHKIDNDMQLNSLHSVISNFVTGLEENFQATISTVCKTADKIGCDEDNSKSNKKCVICESDLFKKKISLTALEATTFSRTVSLLKPQDMECAEKYDTLVQNSFNSNEEYEKNMFPFIHKRLCYSCSRNYSEMNHVTLPIPLKQMLQKEK